MHLAAEDLAHRLRNLFCAVVGQEAQMPQIDAEDGDVLVAHAARRLQEGAVAAQRDGHIGLEVVALYELRFRHGDLQHFGEEAVKSTVDKKLGFLLFQKHQKFLRRDGLLRLVDVTENGYL